MEGGILGPYSVEVIAATMDGLLCGLLAIEAVEAAGCSGGLVVLVWVMPIHVSFGSAVTTGLASVVECCDLSGNCFCCTLGCSFTVVSLMDFSLSVVVTVLLGGLFSSSLSSSSLSSLAELSVKMDLNKSIGGLSSSVT